MGILSWIVFGLIAGAVARYLMPGPQPAGFLITVGLGIAGAVVGGLVGTQLGFGQVTGFNLRSLAIAIGGALAVLFGYQALRK